MREVPQNLQSAWFLPNLFQYRFYKIGLHLAQLFLAQLFLGRLFQARWFNPGLIKTPLLQPRHILPLLILVLLSAGGCGILPHQKAKKSERRVENTLMKAFVEWDKTPYRYGGTTKAGVDCSALVQNIYVQEFRLRLPRTTADQLREGRKVRQSDMRTGDLVFFKTGPNQLHVGIYLGTDRFIHASTSKGVMISGLSERYWKTRFIQARRVL